MKFLQKDVSPYCFSSVEELNLDESCTIVSLLALRTRLNFTSDSKKALKKWRHLIDKIPTLVQVVERKRNKVIDYQISLDDFIRFQSNLKRVKREAGNPDVLEGPDVKDLDVVRSQIVEFRLYQKNASDQAEMLKTTSLFETSQFDEDGTEKVYLVLGYVIETGQLYAKLGTTKRSMKTRVNELNKAFGDTFHELYLVHCWNTLNAALVEQEIHDNPALRQHNVKSLLRGGGKTEFYKFSPDFSPLTLYSIMVTIINVKKRKRSECIDDILKSVVRTDRVHIL